MKAAQINEYGDATVVTINEIEVPTIKDDQVLVQVYASSLNPFDTVVRAGYMKDMIPLQFPATLGGDIAGIVTQVGGAVTNLAVGDKVYGQANVVAGNSGAFAEYAATAASQVAKVPNNLDFQRAGCLPLVGVSALQALAEHIKLQSGQKIFINGGAGAIGEIAVRLAKYLGAYIATTATGDAIEALKSLGANEVIDYTTDDFAQILRDYDAVFDTVGGDSFTKSLSILKKGGIAVSMAAQADQAKADELGVTAISQMTKVTTTALNSLSKLVEAGVIAPHIGKVFTLDQIKEAFETREAGEVRGKIVLKIK